MAKSIEDRIADRIMRSAGIDPDDPDAGARLIAKAKQHPLVLEIADAIADRVADRLRETSEVSS